MAPLSPVFTALLPDPDATRALGWRLGRALQAGPRPPPVVWLIGGLGAGKTCLAQGLAEALGVVGPVPSPTFVLVAEYPDARPPLAHVDLYRLERPEEAESLGIADRIGGPEAWVVEWPERAPELWPDDRLELRLDPEGAGRRATLSAGGPRSAAVLRALEAG